MRSKQYFTSIKNNPHEISTDPKKHIDTYIHHYGSPLEILDKMWYYKGKYEKYYNTWYRRFWHKIRPRSKRRR